MQFEDLNQYDGRTDFPVCNESIATWRRALDGVSVEKGASICSGGEVSFFAILPAVTEQLELIDHSYCSMYYALGKYHVIEKFDVKEAWEVLTSYDEVALHPLFAEGNKNLPTATAVEDKVKPPKKTSYYYSQNRYTGNGRKRLLVSELRNSFKELTQEDIEAFKKNREKVRFLHGDLNDLADRGPFDLVYLSNAMQHRGRNGALKPLIEKLVRPGGYVCYTDSRYSYSYDDYPLPACVADATKVFSETHDGPIHMGWRYNVVKLPEKKKRERKKPVARRSALLRG